MNSKIRLLLCVLLAALLVSLTGLTFSSVQENSLYEAGKLEASIRCKKTDGDSGIPVLEANSVLKRETWIENTGGNPCYIRIKVCIPQAEGVDILELGTLVNDFFLPLDFSENTGRNKTGEYWTKEGEYLYYRNRSTQNILMPQKETPPVYSAIRLNPDLTSEFLAQWTDCEIPIFIQAIQTGVFETEDRAWEAFDHLEGKNDA